MKTLLTIFTFVFIALHSSMSWGEVNKKGVICQCQRCALHKTERGYWFENGTVKSSHFYVKQDQVTTKKGLGVEFTTTPKNILWENSSPHRFNRQTLTLDIFISDDPLIRRTCEVFDKKGYERTWDELKIKHQKSYNKNSKK